MHRVTKFIPAIVALFLLVSFSAAPVALHAGERLVLTRGSVVSLPVGTHRPEIRAASDGTIVVAVVEPDQGRPHEGQVKHRVYRLNTALKRIGKVFSVTRVARPYGEPADHRIRLVNNEIVVVYQTLNYRKGNRPNGGPSEDFAVDQSLLLARFTLEGKEIFRAPIIDRTADFKTDNFPDHCLIWWSGRLLVSSGARSRQLHIREVTLSAQVLSDYVIPTRRDGISGSIGNSMHTRQDGIGFFSSNSPSGNGALTLTTIDKDFRLFRLAELGGHDGVERHFPTDSVVLGKYTLVSYIARPTADDRDMRTNPYHPRLMVLDSAFRIIEDIQLGTEGFAHVHPTLAVLNDHLYVAWSERNKRGAPQVQLERMSISWASGS
jgi:hypothetical protein